MRASCSPDAALPPSITASAPAAAEAASTRVQTVAFSLLA